MATVETILGGAKAACMVRCNLAAAGVSSAVAAVGRKMRLEPKVDTLLQKLKSTHIIPSGSYGSSNIEQVQY